MDDQEIYMEYHWMQVNDDTVTLGLTEEGVDELDNIVRISLPDEDEQVLADEICGEIYTNDGPLNLYSPVDGIVVEVNSSVIENPDLLFDDPTGDGWLYKIRADDPEDLDRKGYFSDDEDDNDDEDDSNDEDEDEDMNEMDEDEFENEEEL